MSELMKRRVFEFCVVITLSIAMLYSGVAWAMENCLRDDAHSSQAASEHRHDSQTPAHHGQPGDPSLPIIHCTSVMHHPGPAALGSSARLTRLWEAVPLSAFLASGAISPEFKNNLWLDALFKRMLTFSFTPDLPRHLFFSVLQI